jgi:hypothetical protein
VEPRAVEPTGVRPREGGRADTVLRGRRWRAVKACLKAQECVHGPTDPLSAVERRKMSRASSDTLCLNVMPFISFHNAGNALATAASRASQPGLCWSCDESSRKPSAWEHAHLS